jgi:hypothetical protein
MIPTLDAASKKPANVTTIPTSDMMPPSKSKIDRAETRGMLQGERQLIGIGTGAQIPVRSVESAKERGFAEGRASP